MPDVKNVRSPALHHCGTVETQHTFGQSLCERPLQSPSLHTSVLCPTWLIPNWISADNGYDFAGNAPFLRSDSNLHEPRCCVRGAEQARWGSDQWSPKETLIITEAEQQPDPTALTSWKPPASYLHGKRCILCANKTHQETKSARQRQGTKRHFSAANCFQSSSRNKWQSSSYCTTDCVVAMKTESFCTLSYH